MKKSTKKAAPKKSAAAKKAVPKKSAKKAVARKSSAPKAATPKKAAKKPATKKGLKAGSIPTRTEGAGTKKPTAKRPVAKSRTAKVPPSPKAPSPKRPRKFTGAEPKRGYGFPADAPELPEAYGEDRLVLMTKDPEFLFAYWEITPERLAEGELAKRAGEAYREAMRLNWAARDLFDANYTLLPVSLAARKWYLRAPYSGLSYQIELGWLGSQGHFIALLGSNPSDAPESWSATRRRLKGAEGGNSVLEYSLEATQPTGSSELGKAERVPKEKPPITPPDFGAPGSADSSSGARGGSGPRG